MEPVITYLKVLPMNGCYEELIAAELIASNQYRLVENPIQPCGFTYGDTVQASLDSKGELCCAGIEEPSSFTTRRFIRSASMKHDELFLRICKPVAAAGGYWENAPAGLAFVHLANDSDFSLDALFATCNYQPIEIFG